MKYKISLVLLIASPMMLDAQKNLTFSGQYYENVVHKNANEFTGTIDYGGANGNANYEYYEDANMERIYNGKFELKQYPNHPANIIGNFKNNLKNGLWSITRYGSFYNNGYVSYVEIAKGNFSQGKLNGLWTYIKKEEKSGKMCMSSKIEFTNNLMTGVFELTENYENKFEIKINYDTLGDNHGSYLVKYWVGQIEFEDKREYNHGNLLSSIHRNLSTGEKLKIGDYGTFWGLYTALNFWVCNGNGYNGCERGDNPIFSFAKGTDLAISNPLKEEIIAKEKLQREQEKAMAEETRKKAKEEEEEKRRIEKEKYEETLKKERFDGKVYNGNVLFEQKKFSQALFEYKEANSIYLTNEISKKIIETKAIIERIDSLQSKRLDIYTYIKNRNEAISKEMWTLKASLENIKEIYGKNYLMCMDSINSTFNSNISSVTSLLSENEKTSSFNAFSWNDKDQESLNMLLKLEKKFKQYETFHYNVKKAFDTNNKDQLKFLKCSKNPNEIISKF